MVTIGPNNISIKGLRDKWAQSNFLKVDGTSGTDPGLTNISLSSFRDALFTDETNVPESGSISIKDHFRNKVFGSSSKTFVTSDFNFNDTFSGEPDRLYTVSSESSNASGTNSEYKFAKLFHNNVSYNYPSILLCPQSGDPAIGIKDDAEVWIKMDLNTPFHFMFGIIHKQNESDWINLPSTALRNRHAAFNDRINIHTYGYITHAGHDIESSTNDELTGGTINNPTDTSNYHNRIGTTAGSGNGFAVVPTNKYYFKTDFTFYQSKLSISSTYYIGMKVNYYEVTLTGEITQGSSTISNVKLNNNQLVSTDNVYTGMYLSSSDNNFPTTNIIIQSISYSSNTNIVMGTEDYGNLGLSYSGTSDTNITFKAYGQRFEFQYADNSFNNPKNIGPKHIILPKNYRISSNGDNNEIDSWAFFVGDSTSQGNSGMFTIQDENPSVYENIYDSFLEISNGIVDSNTYMSGSTADYDGNYHVSETQVYLDGYYNLYIGIKVTSATTYYNDISIAAVQVLTSDNIVRKTWIFNTNGDGWNTYTSETTTKTTKGFPVKPLTAASYSYVNITTTADKTRFAYTSITGSNYTGTKDGIDTTTSAFTVGDNTVPQSGSTNYLYRETSGSTRYTGAIMQSPSQYFQPGDKIRVVHMLAGYSGSRMDPDDSLYLGAYRDLTSEFHSLPVRVLHSDIYMGSVADYDGEYDVSDTIVGHTGSYRIYLGVKITASTVFYNDISIAAIQIVDSTGTTVKKFWNAAYTTGLEWQTYTSETTTKTTKGFPVTPQTASGYSYSLINGTPDKTRFSYTSSTGSQYTGAKGGIENTTSVIEAGINKVSQLDNKNYFYREASSSTRYSGAIMRSPSFSFTAGDRIRVVHILAGYSQKSMDPEDSLYLGLY